MPTTFRDRVKPMLERMPPLRRVAETAVHPSQKGQRLRSVGRAVKFEVNTNLLGRPTRLPVGAAKILAYKGETNSPGAAIQNPINWPEMLVWPRTLKPGDLFLDVGANIGAYTVYACAAGAEVIAVEPVAHNAARIQEHLDLNGYTATVVQKAISDQPGTVRITTDEDSYNHLVDEGGVEVEATTIDDLLGDREAYMKVDVEGAEHLVFAGAKRALAEQRLRLIQMEWVVSDRMGIGDRGPVVGALLEAGYRFYVSDQHGELHLVEGEPPADTLNVFAKPTP